MLLLAGQGMALRRQAAAFSVSTIAPIGMEGVEIREGLLLYVQYEYGLVLAGFRTVLSGYGFCFCVLIISGMSSMPNCVHDSSIVWCGRMAGDP